MSLLLKLSNLSSARKLIKTSNLMTFKRCLTVTTQPQQADKSEISKGTKDNPCIIPSRTDKCIVGCRCNPKDPTISWFYVEAGDAQVCNCGHYFKLEIIDKKYKLPDHWNALSFTEKKIKYQRKRFFADDVDEDNIEVKSKNPPRRIFTKPPA